MPNEHRMNIRHRALDRITSRLPGLGGDDVSKMTGNPLRELWDRLEKLPGGKRLASRLVGRVAPYSGTIGATIVELRDGHATMQLQQRRAVMNHLNSVHAVALMNLGEMCSGVAMMYGMPDDMRGIPFRLEMEYLSKARGLLTATCNPEPVRSGDDDERWVDAEIRDQSGELCAIFRAEWRISPKV